MKTGFPQLIYIMLVLSFQWFRPWRTLIKPFRSWQLFKKRDTQPTFTNVMQAQTYSTKFKTIIIISKKQKLWTTKVFFCPCQSD